MRKSSPKEPHTGQLEFAWPDDSAKPDTAIKSRATDAALDELSVPQPTEAVGEGSPVQEPVSPQHSDTKEPQTAKPPSRWRYGPGHPWFYLTQGDNCPPVAVDDIPATDGVGRFIEREVPKDPIKRQIKLRELLDIEQHDLAIEIERYREIAEKGAEALSRYDREIAHGGNDELARATALSLIFNHIAWGRGRLAWLEQELGKPASKRKGGSAPRRAAKT